jgi:hypothetical protein
MPVTRAELVNQGATGERFHLYLQVGLEQLGHSPAGNGSLEVSYETSAGIVTLIRLTSAGTGITVSGDEPDFHQPSPPASLVVASCTE